MGHVWAVDSTTVERLMKMRVVLVVCRHCGVAESIHFEGNLRLQYASDGNGQLCELSLRVKTERDDQFCEQS